MAEKTTGTEHTTALKVEAADLRQKLDQLVVYIKSNPQVSELVLLQRRAMEQYLAILEQRIETE